MWSASESRTPEQVRSAILLRLGLVILILCFS
jgi:hypothetical protein